MNLHSSMNDRSFSSTASATAARARCAALDDVRVIFGTGGDLAPPPDESVDTVFAVDSFPSVVVGGAEAASRPVPSRRSGGRRGGPPHGIPGRGSPRPPVCNPALAVGGRADRPRRRTRRVALRLIRGGIASALAKSKLQTASICCMVKMTMISSFYFKFHFRNGTLR
jgi:hypothetical protein